MAKKKAKKAVKKAAKRRTPKVREEAEPVVSKRKRGAVRASATDAADIPLEEDDPVSENIVAESEGTLENATQATAHLIYEMTRMRVGKGCTVSQDILTVAANLTDAQDRINTAFKQLKKLLIEHNDNGGKFERGAVSVAFKSTERRNPPWKKLAMDAARELAEAEGLNFNDKVYEEERKAEVTPSTSTSVKFVK